MFKSHPGDKKTKVDLTVGKYICDFGNLVGGPKKYLMPFHNIGKLPTTVSIQVQEQKENELIIKASSDKVKLQPLETGLLHFNLQILKKKNAQIMGKKVMPVFVEVRGGPRYEIDFEVNLTTPELFFSHEVANFGEVPCGQRKIITVRFENRREVECEWSYAFKEDVSTSSRDRKGSVPVFYLSPSSGKLLPGQKINVDLIFTPNTKKEYEFKVQPFVKNTQIRPNSIQVIGKGILQNVKLDKNVMILGSQLPYVDPKEYPSLKIINESSIPVEVFSFELDKEYLKEEKMLMDYRKFNENKYVTFPVRAPGSGMWQDIAKDYEKQQRETERNARFLEIEELLKAADANEEQLKKDKENLEQEKLQDEAAEMSAPQIMPMVDEDMKVNIVIFGWDNAANLAIANHLADKHKRGVIDVSQLLAWNIQKNTPASVNAQNLLAEREREHEEAEKKKKKGKKNEPPPAVENLKVLPDELFLELLKNRMGESDCNPGAIFHCLDSENCDGPISAIKLIAEACGPNHLRVIMLKMAKDVSAPEVTAAESKIQKEDETRKENDEEVTEEQIEEGKLKFKAMKEEEEKAYLDQYLKLEQEMAAQTLKTYNENEEHKKGGERIAIPIEIMTSENVFEIVIRYIPEPEYPDPTTKPLPPPVLQQLLTRPKELHKAIEPIPQFKLLTMKKVEVKEETEIKEEVAKEAKTKTEKGKENKVEKVEEPARPEYEDKTRWIIPAKSSQDIFIKFYSERIGSFKQDLHFGVVDSEKVIELSLEGKSEYPTMTDKAKAICAFGGKRLPPRSGQPLEKHFDKVKNCFDFGPLLIGKEFDKRQQEKCKVNMTKFMFSNTGSYPLHVDFIMRSQCSYYSTENKTAFYVEPQSLDIPYPCESPSEIKVWALPEKPIQYNDSLMCVIKDNPKPVFVNLECFGSKPEAKLEPEDIFFERLLVNQQSTKELKITNKSQIPINWKFKGLNKLAKVFTVQPKEETGVLKPFESTVYQFIFAPLEQQEYNHELTFLVSDEETKEVKQEPKTIKLQAKSYLISVAPRFESDKSELAIGAVKVGVPVDCKFFLKNSGLYEVNYKVLLKTKEYRERFTFKEAQGTLNPSEEKPILMTFNSKTEWMQPYKKESSALAVQIMEGIAGKKREEIPINVNVKAVFSKFSISPARSMNFGPLQYGESKTSTFEIKNEGKFEFSYEIFDAKENKESLPSPEPVPEKGKKPDKKADKKVDKKAKAPEGLKVGQFVITPSAGNIAPNSSVTVRVTFEADGSQFYETNILIDVGHRNYDELAKGVPYQLLGESCVPAINTEDLQSIFEEQRIISTLDPGSNMQNLISKSVFAIEENVFWFGTLVPVKDATRGQTERFKISNPCKIPCTVNLSVKPRTSSKSEGFSFELSHKQLKILPHEAQYVQVSFVPTNIMSYGGIFEALVDNGNPKQKGGKLQFELRGEGVLPTVFMEKPNTIGDNGIPLLTFKKTRNENTQREEIVLKNEGSVPATVRFDPIVSDEFSILSENTATISPKSYKNFEFLFEPKTVGEFKCVISFVTVNNPYEAQKVCLCAESYKEDVMFENLPDNSEDELKMGNCIIGKPKKIQFTMSSKTDKCLRFEWLNHKPEIRFSPRTGFLKPYTTKDIVVVFKGKEPLKMQGDDIWCRYTEIDTGENEIPDWDASVMQTRMVRPSEVKVLLAKRLEEEAKMLEANEVICAQLAAQKTQAAAMKTKAKEKKKEPKKEVKKTVGKAVEVSAEKLKIDESEEPTEEIEEPTQEPAIKLVDNSNKELSLKCTAITDYPRYECVTKKINFKSTLMFQTRSYKFSVKNTSLIAFDYNCRITDTNTGTIDYGPYNIIPRKGTIQAGCEESFIMKFSPVDALDTFERLLLVGIPSLDPEQKPLILEINGSSERPICHFELPPSKYREKKEKDMAPIDGKYNIIEFESLGTQVKNIKRFMVVNPTSQGYDFEWEQVGDSTTSASNYFRCMTPKGTILSGKKFEMTFEYVPDAVGTHESYWEFRIAAEKLVQPFLVVGQVIEPLIMFETTKVDFGPLLIGGKNREIIQLRNQEHIPFIFNFDSKIFLNGEDRNSLSVTPMSGVINPQSTIPIEIKFTPGIEKAYNYNLICKVKRKGRPLNINVKGVGYLLKHEVYVNDGKFPIQPKEAQIDFGDFFINEKKTQVITIVNLGEFNFDFVWKRNASNCFTITPETGSVKKGSKIKVELIYFPRVPHKLSKYHCKLSIVSGPTYPFTMTGSAKKPGVEFNFQRFDFGKCFVMRQPLSKTKLLEMKNTETTALSVDLLFEKKQHLDVQFNPGQVLLPYTEKGNEKIIAPIIFTPREIAKYEETVMFDFNGIYKSSIVITGEGIPLLLDLEKPEDQFVDFGVVKVGGDSTRSINLMNKSKKAATFRLFPASELEFQKSYLSLSTNSDTEYTLKSNESMRIEIRFQPTARMPVFKHEVQLQLKDNETRRLCTISGVSHGIEVKFIEDTLDFGSVVKGSRLTKQLQMTNFGDVPAKFSWETKAIPKGFSIIPESGRVSAHEDQFFEVIFHPNTINEEMVKYDKIPCKIEGVNPLMATFVGKCVDQAKENTKDLYFSTQVRISTTSNITISNPTANTWTIKPTISTKIDSFKDYFKGKHVLEIPPKGTQTYEVAYLPLSMTKEEKSSSGTSTLMYHEGLLFFPLPDGSALLYKLFGKSEPPNALSEIKESAIAKKPKQILLPIKNWLNEVQRFAVSWKVTSDVDPSVFIRGANTFDVASGSSKDYKLNFLACKERNCKFAVTFLNEKSGEYVFYNVEMEIKPAEVLAELELVSVVRETSTKVITIENPLNTPITINKSQFTINNDCVYITPETVTINPQREGAVEVNFRPLVVADKEAILTLVNPDLGTFTYKLLLKGHKSTMQRSMHFKASLGSELMQAFRFTNYMKTATTYTTKIMRISDSAAPSGIANDFKTEQATIAAPPAESFNGNELSLNIKFEPTNIGESRAILTITNPDGMEYVCLLYGHGVAPQPQPITKIQSGKTSPIDFKNPFIEKCEFTIRFDNPCFSLANKMVGQIDAGKSVQLQVKFDYNSSLSTTGRMIISTKDLPPWIYYLHGEK